MYFFFPFIVYRFNCLCFLLMATQIFNVRAVSRSNLSTSLDLLLRWKQLVKKFRPYPKGLITYLGTTLKTWWQPWMGTCRLPLFLWCWTNLKESLEFLLCSVAYLATFLLCLLCISLWHAIRKDLNNDFHRIIDFLNSIFKIGSWKLVTLHTFFTVLGFLTLCKFERHAHDLLSLLVVTSRGLRLVFSWALQFPVPRRFSIVVLHSTSINPFKIFIYENLTEDWWW